MITKSASALEKNRVAAEEKMMMLLEEEVAVHLQHSITLSLDAMAIDRRQSKTMDRIVATLQKIEAILVDAKVSQPSCAEKRAVMVLQQPHTKTRWRKLITTEDS